MKSLTNEFVEFLSDPNNRKGFIWVMVAQNMWPKGVDSNHPKLKEYQDLARKEYEGRRRNKLSEDISPTVEA